jgi:hypothetical protein
MRAVRRLAVPLLLSAVPLALVVGDAQAQDGFLFEAPIVTLTLRAGPMLYRAQSDLFDEITQNLTLNRSDFRAPTVGAELVFTTMPRLDVAVGLGWSRTENHSEFRDLVEQDAQGNELPIRQVTSLRTVPLTASLRYQLLSRGRQISDLAWVPRRTTPYVGAGAGITWYALEQEGDFVNFHDFSIAEAVIGSSGMQATVHGLAGIDYWLTGRLGLNIEARYTHGSVKPQQGFADFDRLDLSGLQVTAGLSLRR